MRMCLASMAKAVTKQMKNLLSPLWTSPKSDSGHNRTFKSADLRLWFH